MLELYKSLWHHPGIAWMVALVMFVLLLRKLPFFWSFALGALLLTSVDATVTGGWSALGGSTHWMYTPLTFIFVLTGDWRSYLLAERFSKPGQGQSFSIWSSSLIWAIIPTLIVALMSKVFFVNALSNSRVMFLTYELLAVILLMLFKFLILPKRLNKQPEDIQRWIGYVVWFQLIHYVLWAISDIIILAGADFGHGLRMIPNIMYYALYVPVVYFLAPKPIKEFGPQKRQTW